MKKAEEIKTIVTSLLGKSDLFLVNATVSGDNKIEVLIDSPAGVNITTCMEISRQLEEKLDRDTEDFELTVASAGIGYPFLVEGQYKKNIGNSVEIRLKEQGTLSGILKAFNGDHIVIECEEKKAVERKKKKETVKIEKTIYLSDIKQIKDIVTF
ncbi:MAG: ribosome assembly cofactor RimP [Odoribacter sp.]|nr:ribosome assembly cofactor RimP [Odoribacter sp.]